VFLESLGPLLLLPGSNYNATLYLEDSSCVTGYGDSEKEAIAEMLIVS